LDGNFIKEFISITDASLYINCTPTDLSVAIGNVKNRRRYIVKGFRWSDIKIEKLPLPKKFIKIESKYRIIGKKVYQYTLNYKFIKEWIDTVEIVDILNVPKSGIRNNLCGISKSCGGYYFSYDSPDKVIPIIIDPYSKVCIKCSERKDLSEFYDAHGGKDHKSGACIPCLKIYKKEQRLKRKNEK
jgi:NUMOD1 domain